jgi:alanyl-tRNA synthetase
MFKSVKDVVKAVEQLQQQNIELQKDVQGLQQKMVASYKEEIKAKLQQKNGIPFIAEKVEMDAAAMKDLAFSLNRDMKSVLIFLLAENKGKVNLLISVSEDLIKNKNLHAGNLIRELAKEVNGGGGGQPHFASAGGSNPAGINKAIDKLKELL